MHGQQIHCVWGPITGQSRQVSSRNYGNDSRRKKFDESVHLKAVCLIQLRPETIATFEQVVTRDECAIFPFAQQVRSVMSNGDLYDAMQAFRQCNVNGSTDGKIRSFYDGDAWKTRPFFELHRDAYVLSFYYDDVTMTNPIGQYKCKVWFFYYSFLDLGPAYSGKDATIFAALLAWEHHLKNEDYLAQMLAHPISQSFHNCNYLLEMKVAIYRLSMEYKSCIWTYWSVPPMAQPLLSSLGEMPHSRWMLSSLAAIAMLLKGNSSHLSHCY